MFDPVFMRLALVASISAGVALGVLGLYLVIRRVVFLGLVVANAPLAAAWTRSIRRRLPRHVAATRASVDNGAERALEIETADGGFIRLAFRATVLPEQLDGVAPGELIADRST